MSKKDTQNMLWSSATNMFEVFNYGIDSSSSGYDCWKLVGVGNVAINPLSINAIIVDEPVLMDLPIGKADGERCCVILLCGGQELFVERSAVPKILGDASMYAVRHIEIFDQDGEQTFTGRAGLINRNNVSVSTTNQCFMNNGHRIVWKSE